MRAFVRAGLIVCLFACGGLLAQPKGEAAGDQEDFALAVAKAHARTGLFVIGSKPFSIHAEVESRLAVRGLGQGPYDNRWVAPQHWQRQIRFADFQQAEMRNDEGHAWVQRSAEEVPLRVQELLRVVVIHVPSSTRASSVPVTKSSISGDHGEALSCYTVTSPSASEEFPQSARWCFDNSTGLLVSQDMPLNTHIVYSDYREFQGKEEFTHVRVTAGTLLVLDLQVQYASLDPHALDAAQPDPLMVRSASAESAPNPEEFRKGSVQYRFSPGLPAGTPDADKDLPVKLQFQLEPNDAVFDACVEEAPGEAMAEAALAGARRFTFTPFLVDGRAVSQRFYWSVWFHSGSDGRAGPEASAQAQPDDANASRPQAPSADRALVTFRSEQPAFTFRYSGDFEQLPQAEIEADWRSQSAHSYGLVPGKQCNTLLFRAQRLGPDHHKAEVLSIYDLSPDCVFGVLDADAIGTVAVNTARSIRAQWIGGSVSKPRQYVVNGRRTFAVVSVRGQALDGEAMNALLVTTAIHGHAVAWVLVGSDENLVQGLVDCTLQVGSENEGPLLSAAGAF